MIIFELKVKSLDGKLKQELSVFIVKQMASGIKVIDWNNHKDKWNLSKGTQLPEPSNERCINILLGKITLNSIHHLKKLKEKMGIELQDLHHLVGPALRSHLIPKHSSRISITPFK